MVANCSRVNAASGAKLFSEQPLLCLPHFTELVATAEAGAMNKKCVPDFAKAASTLAHRNLTELHDDVAHFCKMFDYRNSSDPNADWGNSRDSIERSVAFLTGFEP